MDSPQENSAPVKTESSGWGAVFGIIIIVGLLIIGGIYFFTGGQMQGTQAPAIGAGRA